MLLFLIVVQLLAIGILSWKIAGKFLRNRPAVDPLQSQYIRKYAADGLRYFYEPTAGRKISGNSDWLPEPVTYSINADSLNERFNYTPAKKKNVWRIITLGDSFTFGQGVNTGDNWTELLEDKLNTSVANCSKINKVEVINLGVDGYDIAYEVERYKIRGQKYDPDLILWMVIDPTRIKDEMTANIDKCAKKYPYDRNGSLSNYIDCWAQAEKQLEERYGRTGIQKKLATSFNAIFNYYRKKIIALDLLKSHSSIIKKSDRVSVLDDFLITKYYAMRDKNNKYYLYDGHPNKAGHEIIAEDVFVYLKNNNLIPCN